MVPEGETNDVKTISLFLCTVLSKLRDMQGVQNDVRKEHIL